MTTSPASSKHGTLEIVLAATDDAKRSSLQNRAGHWAMTGLQFRSDSHVAGSRRWGYFVPGMNFDYNQYFERRRETCGGELVIKGTRVTVRTLLASLAEGASAEEIRADFPTVTAEALRAVVAFAAVSAEEDMPVPPMPAAA